MAHFVEGKEQIYGIYSIHKQLAKHGMISQHSKAGNTSTVSHVVVVPNNIDKKLRRVLATWLGEANIRTVDKDYILDRINPREKVWTGTFNKLWLFNMTEFEKIIMLDHDILIRTNIMHWFDYPTPCGILSSDGITWISGAMVIRPDMDVFERMMSQLQSVHVYETDGPHFGDQDFLTSFFLNDTGKQRCVMPTEAAITTSSLRDSKAVGYYSSSYPWLYQTVHFGVKKPWRKSHFKRGNRTISTPPFICSLLREWNESVVGIEEYYNVIPPLENDYLASCV